MPALRPILACLLLSPALAGCGGSGGGSGGAGPAPATVAHPFALFQGTYEVAGVMGEQDGAESIASFWGSGDADGAGVVHLTSGRNNLGTLTDPLPPGDLDYSVGFDRLFRIETNLPGIPLLQGGITEAGDLAAGAAVMPGFQPWLLVFGRKDGAHDEASVAGTWRYARYGGNVLGTLNVAGWGAFTFDDAGGGTSEASGNQEGAVFGPANPLLAYHVVADGGMSVDLGGGFVVTGSIVAGGQVILLTGGRAAGDNPVVYVLVRSGAGHADADLEGEWFMVGFFHDPATNAYVSFTGAMQGDGAGSHAFVGLRNQDGVVGYEPLDGMTSVVAPDGAVTFTTAGGDLLQGGLSADGRFLAAAGTTNAGGGPAFLLFLR